MFAEALQPLSPEREFARRAIDKQERAELQSGPPPVIVPDSTAEGWFDPTRDADKDINIYINSPGGSISAGLAIYDTMQFVRCSVSTV